MTFKWAFATAIYSQKYAQKVMRPLLTDLSENSKWS
jgi:hypothetical protein